LWGQCNCEDCRPRIGSCLKTHFRKGAATRCAAIQREIDFTSSRETELLMRKDEADES
jgi:hypothetical protein